MLIRSLLLLLCLVTTVPVWSWGEVGHGIVNEAATYGVPAEMPEFFHRAYPRLTWLGYQPDRWRGAGDAADAFNAPNHFLDYEYVEHLELPDSRYEYLDLLDSSGTLLRFGIDNDTAGFLPWRVAELAQVLEREWRLWSRRDLSDEERATVEDSILFLSGTLGHYIADAANPHHATIHYNGWAYAPAPAGFATDCSAHWRFETGYVSKFVDVVDVYPLVESPGSPVRGDEYFRVALDLLRESNGLVERLYTLDSAGSFDRSGDSSREAHDFTVGRLARGASVLRDLWYSAFLNGTSSDRR